MEGSGQVNGRQTDADWEAPLILRVSHFLKDPYLFLIQFSCSSKLQLNFLLQMKKAVEHRRLECICRKEELILLLSLSLLVHISCFQITSRTWDHRSSSSQAASPIPWYSCDQSYTQIAQCLSPSRNA